ncbi:hypothetical protein B0T16DRAFT_386480 [Cercophora newfieldiana]|uniref:Uncharacterized protein n=1 Tax=Cercophora newfieldiana TaxID=92897 RepID=A0AA39YSW9_9PEZI|nr:hypothetical protein B0T16DRAFT_386480 [Cercophora newfieldiana]
MKAPTSLIFAKLATLLMVFLIPLATAQNQMAIHYYNDDHCSNLKSSWYGTGFSKMDTYPGGCWTHQEGSSMKIGACIAGDWCFCKLFRETGCKGGYSSMQFSGFPGNRWEYNCKMNGEVFKSLDY